MLSKSYHCLKIQSSLFSSGRCCYNVQLFGLRDSWTPKHFPLLISELLLSISSLIPTIGDMSDILIHFESEIKKKN